MGQVITTAEMKRVVDSNLKAYVEQTTSQYTRLFGRTPTFVKYFSQDLVNGSEDVNLGGVIEIIGPESPVRFKAVHDFPLYGISEADVSAAYDELQGVVSGSVGGEAFVLPGTLEPGENDVFIVNHLETPLVFRVKQVDPDRLEGRPFFKVQYFLDVLDPLDLGRQVSGEYAFELANVGTEHAPLVELDVALLLRELDLVEERLRGSYWRAFYDRSSGTLLLRGAADRPIHDRALDVFVRRNGLLSQDSYLGTRYVMPAEYGDRGAFEDTIYPLTLYWSAERGRWDTQYLTNHVALAPARPDSLGSPFFAEFATDGYFEAVPFPTAEGADLSLGGVDFVGDVGAGDLDDAVPVRQLAKRCLAGHFNRADRRGALREFVDALNDVALLRDRADAFWLLPLAFLQAKRFRDQSQLTTN